MTQNPLGLAVIALSPFCFAVLAALPLAMGVQLSAGPEALSQLSVSVAEPSAHGAAAPQLPGAGITAALRPAAQAPLMLLADNSSIEDGLAACAPIEWATGTNRSVCRTRLSMPAAGH